MKEKKNEILEQVLIASFFFVPLYGVRFFLERLLNRDEIGTTNSMLLGLGSGIVVALYLVFLKPKSIKVKVIALLTVFLILLLLNFVV